MVIRGNTRGNGQQLAQYLLGSKENDQIQILDVAGRYNAKPVYLHQTMQSMSLTAELTKSPKGLYHAQINPAYSEDRKMTDKDWLKATDILAGQLGLCDQRRIVVLHTKKGRTHAHVVFERYNHQTGKIISNSFSRLAQDRARKEMERVFEHAPTPHRNQHRPELKEALTNLWQQTTTGAEFVQAVYNNGYMLAEGVPRHPFMVVDENGRSFDLVRQLKDTRIKDVRQRLRDEKLIPEKQAIEIMRERKDSSSDAASAQQQKMDGPYIIGRPTVNYTFNATETPLGNIAAKPQTSRHRLLGNFLLTGQEIATEQNDSLDKQRSIAKEFIHSKAELTDKSAGIEDEGNVTNLDHNKEGNPTQSDGSQKKQESLKKQFETNEADTSDLTELKQHRKTLSDFMQAEEGMFSQVEPAIEPLQHQQQETARQFIGNEDMTANAPAHNEPDLQKLIQEQKTIRERNRQKTKKRSR